MQCRCGHGRAVHRKGRGKTYLPCQATVRVLKPGWSTPTMAVADRMVTELCKCRDYVLPGAKTQWGGRTKAAPVG